MPILHDVVEQKIGHVSSMLDALRIKEKVVERVGGRTTHTTYADEVNFQERRLSVLEFVRESSEEDVRGRIDEYRSTLGEDGWQLVGKDVRGLPKEIVETIAFAELCLLALGEHPAQRG